MCSGTPSLPKWANGWICFTDENLKLSKILPVKKVIRYKTHKSVTGGQDSVSRSITYVNSKGTEIFSWFSGCHYSFDRKRAIVNQWQKTMHNGMWLQREIDRLNAASGD